MRRPTTALVLLVLAMLLVAGGFVLWSAGSGEAAAPAGDRNAAPGAEASRPAPPARSRAAAPPGAPTPASEGRLAEGWYPAGGAVVDAGGSPVAGASVSLELVRDDRSSSTGCSTDASGHFELNLRGDGVLIVRAHHADVGSAELGLTVDEGSRQAVRDLGLVLQPGLAIAGRVEDDRGAPIAGARFLASIAPLDSPRTMYAAARSKADGSFRILGLVPGAAELEVEHEAHVATRIECEVGADAVVVTMLRGAQVSGVVLDDDGGGVEGASVIVRRPDRRRGFAYDSPRIGADGRFTLRGLPREELQIHPAGVGFLDATPIVIDLRAEHELAGLELRLSRGAAIHGEVVDMAGQPVAGATVGVGRLQDASRGGGSRWIANHQTDERGRFEISGLEAGREYTLHAQHDGCVPEADAASRQTVRSGQEGIVLVLDRGGSISGHVLTVEGTPVAGARVTLVGRGRGPGGTSNDLWTTSAADGAYALRGVAGGGRELRCSSDDHAEAEPLHLEIGAGEQLAGIDIVLDPPPEGVLAGRVTDQHGNPVAGANLSFHRVVPTQERLGSPGARTSSRGEFRIEAVEDVEFRISFQREGYLLAGQLEDPPRVRPGSFLELEVLRLGAVRGRVVDSAGGPVRGAHLSLLRAHDRKISTGMVREPPVTAADGTFELRLLRDPMSISGLAIGAPDGLADLTVPFRFADPASDVDLGDIVLPQGLPVEGTVRAATGSPAVGAKLWLSPSRSLPAEVRALLSRENTQTDDDGRFHFDCILPGAYGMIVDHPEHLRRELDLVVAAGDAPLRIQLESGGSVTGTVTGADGRPQAGARVSVSHQRTETDAGGTYRVGGVTAGTHHVSVDLRTAAGEVGISRVIEHPGKGEVVCDFGAWPTTCEVHGRIAGLAPTGRLGPPRSVALRGAAGGEQIGVEAQFDEELRFRFPPVPPGSYELSIYRLHSQTVEVPASPSYEVLVTLASGRIGGAIERADGERVHRGSVRATRTVNGEYADFRDMQLDDGGQFAFANLPAGTYELEVSIQRYGSTRLEGIELADGQAIESLQVVVTGGGVIDVRILDPAGVAVQDGHLACLDEHGEQPFGRAGATRVAPGTWRLEGLSPGRWQVFAGAQPHGTALPRTVTLGTGESTQLTIQLLPDARRLHVSLTDGGKPAAGAWVTLRDAAGHPFLDVAGPGTGASVRSDGLFTTGGLPPGPYQLEIRAPDREVHHHQLTIAPGEGPVEFTIELAQ